MWFIVLFIVIFLISLVVLPSTLFSWLRTKRRVVRKEDLKTGDIIYTSGTGLANYLFSIASIQGGHALLVVREDSGQLNVLEISGYRDNPSADRKPCIRPLDDRLMCKDWDMFVSVWQYKGDPIPPRRVHEFLANVKDCKFNYKFVIQHLSQRFLGTKREVEAKKIRLCCSEVVYLCLVHCGVIKFNEKDWADSFRYLMQLPTHTEACDLSNA